MILLITEERIHQLVHDCKLTFFWFVFVFANVLGENFYQYYHYMINFVLLNRDFSVVQTGSVKILWYFTDL